MDEPASRLKKELAELGRGYATRLPDRIRAIEDSWNAVCKTTSDMDGLAALFYKIHNLHGSAATYGFHAVSRSAHSLEAIVDDMMKAGEALSAERQAEFDRAFRELERARESDLLGESLPGATRTSP